VNSRSVGIELRNGGCLTPAGDGVRFRTVLGRLFAPPNEVGLSGSRWWESFAEPQMAALSALCREIAGRYGIPPHRFVGHSEVALPPGRKVDPGPLFDWDRLRREADPSACA
jgi:N-acetyl-anhydromuramyl-L-alanine amidase AmpD